MVENITKLVENLSQDPTLKSRNKLGLCRLWTDKILDLVKDLKLDEHKLIVEAREAQIEPGLSHTFIQLRIAEESYLWDGVGTAKHPPYFGPETKAPEHLRNHTLDMISRIRKISRSGL